MRWILVLERRETRLTPTHNWVITMGKQRKGEFQEKRFAQRKKGPPGKPIFKKKQKFEKKPKPEKPSISEIEGKTRSNKRGEGCETEGTERKANTTTESHV
ncbi:unnamed protein product [Hermetia illucens]|uniref:Uncharacterized protein n=1 Tax=Hermetia illucens TaxID=343691 RepID=A0A7R8UK81_HERIL|nr:unnamed protein product [Hermetia illucens]